MLKDVREVESENQNMDCVYGCFLSHLRALRTFVDSNEPECLVLEDDLLLIDDFPSRYLTVRQNIPDSASLIMVASLISSEMEWGGIDPDQRNVKQMGDNPPWGTQGYLIRREYALECLEKYDRPFTEILKNQPSEEQYITSELFTRNSRGLVMVPPLIIEDSVLMLPQYNRTDLKHCFEQDKCQFASGSDLRSDIQAQALNYAQWGPEKYLGSEV